MPRVDFCGRCGKEIPISCIPWLPAYDGLCSECQSKVRERLNGAVEEFKSSLRSDGVDKFEIERLAKRFFDKLAREE